MTRLSVDGEKDTQRQGPKSPHPRSKEGYRINKPWQPGQGPMIRQLREELSDMHKVLDAHYRRLEYQHPLINKVILLILSMVQQAIGMLDDLQDGVLADEEPKFSTSKNKIS